MFIECCTFAAAPHDSHADDAVEELFKSDASGASIEASTRENMIHARFLISVSAVADRSKEFRA